LGEEPRGLVAVAPALPRAPEPVGGRVALALSGPRDEEPAPARGGLDQVAAKPRRPAEAPEGGRGLLLVRIVGGELPVHLLRLGGAAPRLEPLRFWEERVR